MVADLTIFIVPFWPFLRNSSFCATQGGKGQNVFINFLLNRNKLFKALELLQKTFLTSFSPVILAVVITFSQANQMV